MAKTLPIYIDNGISRPLGHIAPRDDHNVSNSFVSALIPESDWVEFDLREHKSPIKVKDQDGRGACNGFAAASSLEWARWLAGQSYQPLSAWFVYSILCNGIDRGSNIGDALTLLSTTGTCIESEVPYGTINPRNLTAENRKRAAQFRIEIGSKLRTFNDLMSATQLRRPFNFSLRAGGNFGQLDSHGCIPINPGVGNHAITGGLGAKKLPNGEWAILWQNSWSTSWGDEGFAWFRRANIERQSYFEAYEVAAPIDSENDPNNPPVLI